MKRQNEEEKIVVRNKAQKDEILKSFHSKSGHSGMYVYNISI